MRQFGRMAPPDCGGRTMPNPFPGMDPYLEGDLWTSVHTDLTAEIARQLAPKVRPKYVTRSARRIVLATPDPTELPPERSPDVFVVNVGVDPHGESESDWAARLARDALTPVPIPQTTVEIRGAAG